MRLEEGLGATQTGLLTAGEQGDHFGVLKADVVVVQELHDGEGNLGAGEIVTGSGDMQFGVGEEVEGCICWEKCEESFGHVLRCIAAAEHGDEGGRGVVQQAEDRIARHHDNAVGAKSVGVGPLGCGVCVARHEDAALRLPLCLADAVDVAGFLLREHRQLIQEFLVQAEFLHNFHKRCGDARQGPNGEVFLLIC